MARFRENSQKDMRDMITLIYMNCSNITRKYQVYCQTSNKCFKFYGHVDKHEYVTNFKLCFEDIFGSEYTRYIGVGVQRGKHDYIIKVSLRKTFTRFLYKNYDSIMLMYGKYKIIDQLTNEG